MEATNLTQDTAVDLTRDQFGALQRDITRWSHLAKGAFSDLERMLEDMGDVDTSYDFSVTVDAELTAFDAAAPEITPIEAWTPEPKLSYRGPRRVDSHISVGAQPELSLSPFALDISTEVSVRDIPNAARPSAPSYSAPTFTDPGSRPTGNVDAIDSYTPPVAFDPDLSVLNFGTVTPPNDITVRGTTVAFPSPVSVPTPTYSRPGEVAVHQPARVSWQDPGDRPEWDGKAPVLDFGGEPGAFRGSDTPEPVVLTPITMPTYSGPDDPDAPDLWAIDIPTIRDVTLPTFDDLTTPQDQLPSLTAGLSYSDPGYSDAQIDTLRSEISRVLNGDLGIPGHMWEAIWDKAAMQITRAGVTHERQGRQAWAKLGWSMPGGVALAQREQAAFDVNQQLSEKAREQAIQRATMEREDFWQAVQQGVTFQKLMMDQYNAFQERQLRAAVAMVEVQVNVYNANVQAFNAKLARTQAEVAVKEMQLRGALSNLEVDKLKLEGTKLEAEIQQQLVQVYASQWEGVRSAVAKYQAMVQAKNAELEIQRARVQNYGEQVKARAVEVDAWAKEWDGYVAKIEGQKAKAAAFETESRAFSERMKGYGLAVESEKARVGAQVQAETLMLEKSKTEIENFRSKWAGLQTELDTQLKLIDARVQNYSATAQAKGTEGGLQVENEKLKVGLYDSQVRGYSAEIQGASARAGAVAQLYGAEAERYRADVQGASAAVDASARRAQAQAQVFDSEVRAYAAAVDAERTKTEAQKSAAELQLQRYRVDAEVNKSISDVEVARSELDLKKGELEQRYESLKLDAAKTAYTLPVEKFKADVQAYGARAQAKAVDIEAESKRVDASRAALDADIAALEAETRSEAARVSAQAQVEQAKASMANARSSWAESKAKIEAVRYEASAKQAELDQRGMIEAAKVQLQQMLSLTELQAKGLESLGGMYSQLAAGAYAAANISAGVNASSSKNNSTALSESHNYNYEVAAG